MDMGQQLNSSGFSAGDGHTEPVPPEAEGLVAALCLALALFLIALAPFVTRAQPADKAWFLAPVIGPVFSLVVMALPAFVLVRRWRRGMRAATVKSAYLQQSGWAFGDFKSAVEYGVYFCIYLWAIHYVGFAFSTLIFGQVCLSRSGLTSRQWMLTNLVFTIVIVVLLRGLLGLWFPMAPVFKMLPSGIGNALGTYL
jgi:hypothetical protein